MPNPAAATKLAADLGRLPHPSGAMVAIPGFDRHAATHPELAEAHGQLATMIAEAIINDLELDGYEIAHKHDIQQKARDLAAELAGDTEMVVRCRRCREKLFKLNTGVSSDAHTDPATLATALTDHAKTCR